MSIDLSGQATFDLVVIGGGVNGAGVARDAAGRGLKVLLCEKDDFAQHTSSASTKLIHGGLRYLENLDFKLVRHSLREREVLLQNSPHIIWPLRFVLPHDKTLRPRWFIRSGLFCYDHMAPLNLLEKSKGVDLRRHVSGEFLKEKYLYGFEYSDCWVQDSRLVILNVMDAAALGAQVLSRTRCTDLKRDADHWLVTLVAENERSMLSDTWHVKSRAIVDASGAWVDRIGNRDQHAEHDKSIVLIRGSHIVVPKLFEHPYAYIFQNSDRRIMFCIPYEQDFTLIGTTEVEVQDPEHNPKISDSEINYLCRSVNRYLRVPVNQKDVVWSYSGTRALFDDGSSDVSRMTRNHVLKLDDSLAPIVSVYGGKITTYRILAENVLDLLRKVPNFDKPRWTSGSKLPGGELGNSSVEEFANQLSFKYEWLPVGLADRYARHYGACSHDILNYCSSLSDLGQDFSVGLYQAEVDYLISREFARSAEDIIWRRTRLGIRMNRDQITELSKYVDAHVMSTKTVTGFRNANVYS